MESGNASEDLVKSQTSLYNISIFKSQINFEMMLGNLEILLSIPTNIEEALDKKKWKNRKESCDSFLENYNECLIVLNPL